MPEPNKRSRTLRRVHKRTPSGKSKLTYQKRKPSKHKCGSCGKELHGIPRERPFKMMTLAKTKKRPERAYGGVLCSACARKTIVAKTRA